MSDKENTPDEFENDDFLEEEQQTVETVDPSASVDNADDGQEDESSNIDDDFDEDDLYMGSTPSKSKWLNIIGIGCFTIAGVVGVWQFWLSGVDKYDSANTVPVAEIAPAPVIDDTATAMAGLPVEPVVDDMDTAVMTDDALPDMSVEMSEEDVADADLMDDAMAQEDMVAMPETEKADISEDVAEEMDEVEVDAEVTPEPSLIEETAETEIDTMPEDMSVETVEDVSEEETVIPEVETEGVAEVMPPVDEKSEVMGVADMPDAATVEPETFIAKEMEQNKVVDTPAPTPEPILEKVTEETPAVPAPKEEKLEPIIREEYVEEVPTAIVPETVEYGSLTPAQILERAVVVRPTPKKLVVVQKNSSSTSSRSILVAADRSLKQGNFADALSLYNDVLETNPKDTSALMGKALTLQKLNHNADALNAYQAMLDVDPNNLNALTNYLGLLQNDDPMVSINRLKEMEVNNPRSAAISGTLGMLYGQMKDVSNAAAYFDKAQKLDPNNAVYPYNLAVISDRMGSQATALEQYQKTLQLVLRYGGQGVVSEQIVSRRIKELMAAQ